VPGLDREKHAAFWKTGAEEDLGAAARLLETGHRRHGLFFAHLAVEKALKGLATLRTGEVPPKSHDLLRLADVAGLVVDEERAVAMARLGRFCMEGRYPESWAPPPSKDLATEVLEEAKGLVAWLSSMS
jgi:HEPN domain-containing protein